MSQKPNGDDQLFEEDLEDLRHLILVSSYPDRAKLLDQHHIKELIKWAWLRGNRRGVKFVNDNYFGNKKRQIET